CGVLPHHGADEHEGGNHGEVRQGAPGRSGRCRGARGWLGGEWLGSSVPLRGGVGGFLEPRNVVSVRLLVRPHVGDGSAWVHGCYLQSGHSTLPEGSVLWVRPGGPARSSRTAGWRAGEGQAERPGSDAV